VSRPWALLGPSRIGFWPPAPAPRLTASTSGGGRPVRGPRHRDVTCQTRTLAAPGADATAAWPDQLIAPASGIEPCKGIGQVRYVVAEVALRS